MTVAIVSVAFPFRFPVIFESFFSYATQNVRILYFTSENSSVGLWVACRIVFYCVLHYFFSDFHFRVQNLIVGDPLPIFIHFCPLLPFFFFRCETNGICLYFSCFFFLFKIPFGKSYVASFSDGVVYPRVWS